MSASHSNKCPQCGAVAEGFSPETELYTCKFCQTPFQVRHPQHKARKRELERLAKEQEREKDEQAESTKKVRENRAGTLFGVGAVGLVCAITGGIMYYDAYIAPWRWDGHRSFSCSSGKGTITDIQATGRISAHGTCILTLVRPALEATITVDDHAVINVIGGRIHSSSTPVTAKGFGRIVLDGTTVESADGREAVSVDNAASVESKKAIIKGSVKSTTPRGLVGFPPPPPAPPAPVKPAWRGGDLTAFACAGVTQCLESTGAKGPVSGYMAVEFEENGKAKGVSLGGGTPQGLAKCFVALGSSKSIPPVGGVLAGACTIQCTYSGTIKSPATSINFSSQFFP